MHDSDVLDEQYLKDAQDPNDPVWESDAVIADMQSVDDPNDDVEIIPHVRNSKGDIDFLNDIVEEVEDFLSVDKPVKPKKAKLDRLSTREFGADKWRGRSAVVTANPFKVVEESAQRRSLEIFNTGGQTVYLSSISSVAGAPNTFALPAASATLFPSVKIPSTDDVWAVCAAGLASSVGVIEVFDMES